MPRFRVTTKIRRVPPASPNTAPKTPKPRKPREEEEDPEYAETVAGVDCSFQVPDTHSFAFVRASKQLDEEIFDGDFDTAKKSSKQSSFKTQFIFLNRFDKQHSFFLGYIQTRYNLAVINFQKFHDKNISALQALYVEAVAEDAEGYKRFDARFRYIKAWKNSPEDLLTITPKQIEHFRKMMENLQKQIEDIIKNGGTLEVAKLKSQKHNLDNLLGSHKQAPKKSAPRKTPKSKGGRKAKNGMAKLADTIGYDHSKHGLWNQNIMWETTGTRDVEMEDARSMPKRQQADPSSAKVVIKPKASSKGNHMVRSKYVAEESDEEMGDAEPVPKRRPAGKSSAAKTSARPTASAKSRQVVPTITTFEGLMEGLAELSLVERADVLAIKVANLKI
ncbi:hypothetical protein NA57DRAFT_78720 [Rhizodiscina lignyota]|uniref:Uncharacterized protein n=1 Tax=Rhizodiscina lignyota TaxID=1504668 RepID=A0A9P4I6A1_9PEZI|nr:hypothetical protein NA57DRAFT_78720 [Rhizodiscina lignyota]